jgi:hypothetical protein
VGGIGLIGDVEDGHEPEERGGHRLAVEDKAGEAFEQGAVLALLWFLLIFHPVPPETSQPSCTHPQPRDDDEWMGKGRVEPGFRPA